MRTRVTALFVVPLLLVTACSGGNDDDAGDDDSAEPTGALEGVEIAGDYGAAPKITVKDLKAEEQTSVELSLGDGPEVDIARDTLLDLALVNGVDGTDLLNSWTDTQPQVIGPDTQLIKGLLDAINSAIDGKPRGSRVAFSAPAEDLVGAEGLTQLGVKADDALVMVADILSVEPESPLEAPEGEAAEAPEGSPTLVEKDGNVTGFDWAGVGQKPAEMQVITLIEGDGPAIAEKRLVTFDYFGEVFKGKEAFDESYSEEPVTFAVGANGLIDAWDEGLIGVKEGSRVMIIAPPDKAYGAEGRPPSIPGDSTLVFVLDVLNVDG